MNHDPAYLVADPSGSCIHATAAALGILGMDEEVLRRLKVSDLFPSGAPEGLSQRLQTATEPGSWTTTDTEIIRGDASIVRVRLTSMRTPSGDLVLRLERCEPEPSEPPTVRDVLQAWRREEADLAARAPGTTEHLVAEVEAQRLGTEYRRLIALVADEALNR
jgi:hypothetical protein